MPGQDEINQLVAEVRSDLRTRATKTAQNAALVSFFEEHSRPPTIEELSTEISIVEPTDTQVVSFLDAAAAHSVGRLRAAEQHVVNAERKVAKAETHLVAAQTALSEAQEELERIRVESETWEAAAVQAASSFTNSSSTELNGNLSSGGGVALSATVRTEDGV